MYDELLPLLLALDGIRQDPAMAQQFLVKEIENLRKRQEPVMMVFAGRR